MSDVLTLLADELRTRRERFELRHARPVLTADDLALRAWLERTSPEDVAQTERLLEAAWRAVPGSAAERLSAIRERAAAHAASPLPFGRPPAERGELMQERLDHRRLAGLAGCLLRLAGGSS